MRRQNWRRKGILDKFAWLRHFSASLAARVTLVGGREDHKCTIAD